MVAVKVGFDSFKVRYVTRENWCESDWKNRKQGFIVTKYSTESDI